MRSTAVAEGRRAMGSSLRHRHAVGLTRRELIQVGYSGLLGFGLPSLWSRARGADSAPAAPGPRPRPRAKSVLLIFQTGAPSQIDTFDPKPEAPEEIRGTFQ